MTSLCKKTAATQPAQLRISSFNNLLTIKAWSGGTPRVLESLSNYSNTSSPPSIPPQSILGSSNQQGLSFNNIITISHLGRIRVPLEVHERVGQLQLLVVGGARLDLQNM